ncbi:MAG: hypothetical protein IIB54_14705 [Planctomycetes bacterium]|nr:hypothetical protein [Planctomycetota bacterium]
MTEPNRRIIIDGVAFSQVVQFPKLLGSCTAAFQPARLLIGLLMVTAVMTFGRAWDGLTEPTVHPGGLLAGRWTEADRQALQPVLLSAMDKYALPDDRFPEEVTEEIQQPNQVIAIIEKGYREIRKDVTEPEQLEQDDREFRELVAMIERRAPMGTFDASVKLVGERFQRMIDGVLALSIKDVLAGAQDFAVLFPRALWNQDRVLTIALGLVLLLVYVVGGGALCRMAACQFAGRVRLRMSDAIDFALVNWIRSVLALILPLGLALFLALIIVLLGALMIVPILDVLGGLLYGVALLVGFVLAFVLVGYAAGFAMILPAVACEKCDWMDANQKAFAFVYQRPLHLLGYAATALIGLVLGYLVFGLFTTLMLNMTASLFGMISGHPALNSAGDFPWFNFELRRVDPWVPGLVSGLIMFWQTLVVSLVGAYIVSFVCDVSTRLYLLIRRACDDQEIGEIWWPGMIPGTIGTVRNRTEELSREETT